MATESKIVVGNSAAPQPGVVLQQAAPQLNCKSFQRSKKKVKILAIAELVLGSLCMLVSIGMLVMSCYPKYFRRYYDDLIFDYVGEGLWGGVWVVIAGGLGISTAKAKVSRCTIICHMAFSIVGAIAAAAMFLCEVMFALFAFGTLSLTLYSIEAVLAFISMTLSTISASYTCLHVGCCSQTVSTQMYGTQIYYHQQPPLLGQDVPGIQQGHAIQTQSVLQSMPTTTSVFTTSFPFQQITPIVQNQQPNSAEKQAEVTDNPPSYPSLS